MLHVFRFRTAVAIISCAWTLDIVLSFVTGYMTEAGLVMRFGSIARHYMRNMFCLDLVLVLADWSEFVAEEGGGVLKVLRLARLTRFLRVMAMIIIHPIMTKFK